MRPLFRRPGGEVCGELYRESHHCTNGRDRLGERDNGMSVCSAKDFGILRQRFRHGYELHKMVLLAVAVIVQYDMENGHPLFDV